MSVAARLRSYQARSQFIRGGKRAVPFIDDLASRIPGRAEDSISVAALRSALRRLILIEIEDRASGDRLPPLEVRLQQAGGDSAGAVLRVTVRRKHRLFDTRDPDDSYRLDKENPRQSAKYYFQVRNNLTHRGKGAWQDAEIVRQSLQELLTIMR